jgi:16S rRNA (cytidine1402-2'-O)-methyltransferase
LIGLSGSGGADGVTQAAKALVSKTQSSNCRQVRLFMALEQALYIVATPIGNRSDMSARAVDVLSQVDRIYAEDTRHSLPLLRHHGIETRIWPLHEHNEDNQVDNVINFLHSPATAALITDAGTPLISDPGFRLVRACQQSGIRVSPIPGACSLTAALSVCGIPTDRFQFVGFVPSKSLARKAFFQPLKRTPHTLVMFESPHRIVDCLSDIVSAFGEQRTISLARELTKKFETVLYGAATTVQTAVSSDPNQQKGEFVIVISGAADAAIAESHADAVELEQTLAVLLKHLPVKTAARCGAEIFGMRKKKVYELALAIQGR